jgi:predicted RNase H-like nuclease (RuvC/YqgF family)
MDECTKCGSRESERHMQQANKLRVAELEQEVERLKRHWKEDDRDMTELAEEVERLTKEVRDKDDMVWSLINPPEEET